MKSVSGVQLFLQPVQDINIGGRLTATQYQYALTDVDFSELNRWAPIIQDALGKLPQIIALTTDPKSAAPTATIQGNFQGNAQAFQSSLSSTPILILAALIAVYLILGMLYENVIHPLTIISTLPSAGLGALLVLYVFGFGLDVMGIIGIILLIGIVKKNGIMLVDFALEAERH